MALGGKILEKVESTDSMLMRYFKLLMGYILFAAGIVITMNANLGYSPWDVFHKGLGNILDMKIGNVSIMIGFIIIVAGWIKGQKPGMGTILNMFLVGTFMNIFIDNNIFPTFSNIYMRFLSLFLGIIIMGYATYIYIAAGLGAGPRDGLMLLLNEKTGKSISFVRNSMEIIALIIGYILGGPVGIGTLIISIGIGYAVQFSFDIFKFDPQRVHHRSWDDEVEALKRLIKSK